MLADPYAVTTPFRRRRPARRPAILSVSDTWRLDGAAYRRRVTIRTAAGDVVEGWVLDDHPALVAFLDRAAVAA